jgi:polar amino acid transport system substrate-binding protein
VLTAPDTPRLAAAIDAAIGRLIGDGRLKSLYDRWDLAGRQQMLLLRDATEVPPAPRGTLAELVRDTLPLLLRSAGMTLFLSCVAFPLAVLIGLAVAVGRTYGPPFLRPLLVIPVAGRIPSTYAGVPPVDRDVLRILSKSSAVCQVGAAWACGWLLV